jgi:hypothetical protein
VVHRRRPHTFHPSYWYPRLSGDNAAAYMTVFLSTITFCSVGGVASFWAPSVDALLGGSVVVTLEGGGEMRRRTMCSIT